MTFDEQFTTVDNDVITDAYKRKLLNLANWNTNMHQTQTDKLSNDSITFAQDWDAITPSFKNEVSSVDDNSQISTSCDNAPQPRTHKVCNKDKKDKNNITLKQASPKPTKHNLRNIRKYFERTSRSRTLKHKNQYRQSEQNRTPNVPMNIKALNAEIQHLLSNTNFRPTSQLIKLDSPPTSLLDKTINELQTMAFLASTNPINNLLTHSSAMKADDREKFLISMKDKIDRLIEHDVFERVDIDTIPHQCKILRAIWAHRRKTTPSGEAYKHKSWICADVSQL